MGFMDCLALGWDIASNINNLIYCFIGVFNGNPHRCSSRYQASGSDRPSSARLLWNQSGFSDYHAGRDLLRSLIRRINDIHLGQHSRRVQLCDYMSGRLPDGQAGPGRPGSGDSGFRIFYRRDIGSSSF